MTQYIEPALWSIGTVVASAIIAILVTKWFARARLVLLLENSINLYSDIARNLDTITLLHRGEEVDTSLHLINVILINHGNKDVVADMVHLPARITLTDCLVRDVDLRTDTEEPKPLCELDERSPNSVTIKTPLFQKGEILRIRMLVSDELDAGDRFRALERLKIEGRIANTDLDKQELGDLGIASQVMGIVGFGMIGFTTVWAVIEELLGAGDVNIARLILMGSVSLVCVPALVAFIVILYDKLFGLRAAIRKSLPGNS